MHSNPGIPGLLISIQKRVKAKIRAIINKTKNRMKRNFDIAAEMIATLLKPKAPLIKAINKNMNASFNIDIPLSS